MQPIRWVAAAMLVLVIAMHLKRERPLWDGEVILLQRIAGVFAGFGLLLGVVMSYQRFWG